MIKRDLKRIVIGVLAFCFSSLFFISFYFLIIPNPSCYDGRRNQGEERVDCGGPCASCLKSVEYEKLEIINSEWTHDIDNLYDVKVKVFNPNSFYGLQQFFVNISFEDSSGNVIFNKRVAADFILPGQTRDFLFFAQEVSGIPNEMSVFLGNDIFAWEKMDDVNSPNFVINNKRYVKHKEDEVAFSSVQGKVINQSSDFLDEVLVYTLLYDSDGRLLALNSQILGNLSSGSSRDFKMSFFHEFDGVVDGVEVRALSNPTKW